MNRKTLGIILGVTLLFLVGKTLGYEAIRVNGAAMAPAINSGQYVIAAKWPYGYNRYSVPKHLPILPVEKAAVVPERGDIIVFVHPRKRNNTHVSRVIGLPGETIRMKDGFAVLNGQQLSSQPVSLPQNINLSPPPQQAFVEILPNGKSYLVLDIEANSDVDNTENLTVPEGHVFVMGDNRDNSKDSRTDEHSIVPLEAIYGRVDHFLYTL